MDTDEIMRLISQALFNVPREAPERDMAHKAFGALTSKMNYKGPRYTIVLEEGGFTRLREEV